jgi:hypothetical protein
MKTRFAAILGCCLFHAAFVFPIAAQGGLMVSRLEFTIKTGGDDLRGGNDNLNVAIHFRNGAVQLKQNVNDGRSWGNNTVHGFSIVLEHSVASNGIAAIEFHTTFGGGTGGDNWDMASVSVKAIGPALDKVIVTHGFYRFTGDENRLVMPVTIAETGKAVKLELTIQTGGDDLRGDNDNLDIVVNFNDGRTQLAKNINRGRNWANGSKHTETITLNHAVDPREIVRIDLLKPTTCSVVVDCDNWDMSSILVNAVGEGVNRTIASNGFKRFTGQDNFLSIPVTPGEAGKANKLEFTFQTGDDDLRSDNEIDVTIHFRGGHTQLVPNLNGGQGWGNQSTHTKTLTLEQTVDPKEIIEVDLQTSGGAGGHFQTEDNWNMASVSVKAIGVGVDEIIFKHGFKRFKHDPREGGGSDNTLRLTRDQ